MNKGGRLWFALSKWTFSSFWLTETQTFVTFEFQVFKPSTSQHTFWI